MIEKPMLASAVKDLEQLKYPVMGSPKLDGIRCLIRQEKALSRSLKPIRNNYVRALLETVCPDNLDGELTVGSNIQETTSAIMTITGEPDFTYWVFDYLPDGNSSIPFITRYRQLQDLIELHYRPFQIVPNLMLWNIEDVLVFEEEMLTQGHEGIILRDPNAPYKFGRSTVKEGYLLKMKRFTDDEGVIVGFKEYMHNTNEASVDELGHTKRSSSKEGKISAGIMGAILVKKDDKIFECGTGFSLKDRKEIWDNQDKYLGKLLKYKYQDYGVKNLPRIPVFLGLRDREDL